MFLFELGGEIAQFLVTRRSVSAADTFLYLTSTCGPKARAFALGVGRRPTPSFNQLSISCNIPVTAAYTFLHFTPRCGPEAHTFTLGVGRRPTPSFTFHLRCGPKAHTFFTFHLRHLR